MMRDNSVSCAKCTFGLKYLWGHRVDFPGGGLLQSDGFGGLSSLHIFCLGTRYIFSNTGL